MIVKTALALVAVIIIQVMAYSPKNYLGDGTLLSAATSDCSCGRGGRSSGRISGGAEARSNMYPWMVRIRQKCYRKTETYISFCGGSLVSPRVVLSAYHCPQTRFSNCEKPLAILGAHTILSKRSFSDEEDVIEIEEALYPEFAADDMREASPYGSSYDNHDFQLYVLSKPARYTSKVGPICLPEPYANFGGMQAIAAGWGMTELGGGQSPVLKHVELRVKNNESPNYWKMFETEVGWRNGEYQDPCKGDSGGPLMFYNRTTSRYVLIGTVNGYGYNCKDGRVNGGGRWNKVSAHMGWILNTLNRLGEKGCI